jgi:hypothetical protein
MSCLIYHKWTRWNQYTRKGNMVINGIMFDMVEFKDKFLNYKENYQVRFCKECGKRQDEFISYE